MSHLSTMTENLRVGIGGRLLAAQSLVLLAGAATTWLVASSVGPSIFRDHVRSARVEHTAAETRHVEEAFNAALLISMSVALVASAGAALAVSWYFSRRVSRSISPVTAAASEIAAGEYGTRVPDPGLGGEFATLTATFNALAERLATLQKTRRGMLADLAHEMRTPLATIEAHLEAIEDGVRELDEGTLGVIRTSTRRLGRLAEDIVAVSSAEEGNVAINRQPVNATAIAAAVLSSSRDRYTAKGVELRSHFTSNARVLVDPDRIGQVLTNLLDNALRHTPMGGVVTLDCSSTTGWVRYAVTDTGDGIGTEHLRHVFDRFYRADTARDRTRGGSGIGLAIARALTEAHGGTIGVTSEGTGRGATFTVRLPTAG